MDKMKLGDKVRCIYSGFTGIAVAKTEFINGCVQWNILPKGKSDKMAEELSLDEKSLEVIKPKKKKIKKDDNGGPMRRGIKMRGF